MKNNDKIPTNCIIKYGQDQYPFQEFNGKRYHLYPNEKYYSRGIKRLHVVVYRFYNGVIPPGFAIHHKDENTHNNHPLNLEMMLRGDHQRLHMGKRDIEEMRKTINHARKFASKWHSSPEGRAWHRELAKSMKYKTIEKICAQCGKPFTTIALSENGHAKFCSNNCKSEARRKSGVDDIEVKCSICGQAFIKNRYARKVTCSNVCQVKLRKITISNSAQTPYF